MAFAVCAALWLVREWRLSPYELEASLISPLLPVGYLSTVLSGIC